MPETTRMSLATSVASTTMSLRDRMLTTKLVLPASSAKAMMRPPKALPRKAREPTTPLAQKNARREKGLASAPPEVESSWAQTGDTVEFARLRD